MVFALTATLRITLTLHFYGLSFQKKNAALEPQSLRCFPVVPHTPIDRCTKNKGIEKDMNMPAKVFQEWINQVQRLNFEKNNEHQMEIQNINHEK